MGKLNELLKDAIIHFKKGEFTDAIKNYMIILNYRPKLAEVWNNLGLCYTESGNLNEAIEAFKKGVEINPEKESIWKNYGIAYYRLKQYDKVVETFEVALNYFPDNFIFLNNLGVAYGNLNEIDKAIEIYKKALDLNPKYESAWKNLCSAYLNKGVNFNYGEYKPNTEVAYFFLAKDLLLSGLLKDGLYAINKCLTLNPGFHAAFILRTKIRITLEKQKTLQELDKKAPAKEQKDPLLERFKKVQKKKKQIFENYRAEKDPHYERFKLTQDKLKKRIMELDDSVNQTQELVEIAEIVNIENGIKDDKDVQMIKPVISEKPIEITPNNKDLVPKTPKPSNLITISGKDYEPQKVTLVIDGSNVARDRPTSHFQGRLKNLEILIQRLVEMGLTNYKILCDRSLRHKIDEPLLYSKWAQNGDIIETPAGTEADYFILQFAKEKDAFIISNDRFKEFAPHFGKEWIRSKRITFQFFDEEVYLDKIYRKYF